MMAQTLQTDVGRAVSELKRCVSQCEEIEHIVAKLLQVAPLHETDMVYIELQKLDYLRQHLTDVAGFLDHALNESGDKDGSKSVPSLQLEDVQRRLLGLETETVAQKPKRSDMEWL